jgi:hypothetical protein
VDGAPAARFTERFKELIETGYGLDRVRLEGWVDALEPAPL